MYRIEIFETTSGKRPFSKWLADLKDLNGRAKIRVRLDRVRLGNFGQCESVGDGVSELKINYGPGYRVYFGLKGKRIVLLLCGGSKRTQSKDISNAIAFFKEFKEGEKR